MDLFGLKARRALLEKRAKELSNNNHQVRGWVDHSEEFANLSSEAQVNIIKLLSDHSWLIGQGTKGNE